MNKLRVTIWNENLQQSDPVVAANYPQGIHGKIAEMLGKTSDFEIRTATLADPECGLPQKLLDETDVLIWWGHIGHDKVTDEVAERVRQRVWDGMGFIVLHSGHLCKPFKLLMGTRCRSKWWEDGDKERIWVIEPGHPIARGLPEYIELPQEETYGERFELPAPDELVFISWFSGGAVCRSGCCYKRGLGKIFYFRPGHEAYPIYHRDDITQILKNAVEWAQPSCGPAPTLGQMKALEKNAAEQQER